MTSTGKRKTREEFLQALDVEKNRLSIETDIAAAKLMDVNHQNLSRIRSGSVNPGKSYWRGLEELRKLKPSEAGPESAEPAAIHDDPPPYRSNPVPTGSRAPLFFEVKVRDASVRIPVEETEGGWERAEQAAKNILSGVAKIPSESGARVVEEDVAGIVRPQSTGHTAAPPKAKGAAA